MAVGKLVTKAAAPVVEEVVSQFTKRLFRGAKIPPKTQKIVGNLNKIDQKTILSSIRKEPEIAEGWKNMFINAGSDDVEVKLSAFEELNQSLTRFRGEAKLQQKENRIDDMFYTDAKNTTPPELTQPNDISGAPTSESILRDFPAQRQNVDTDLPSYISEKDARLRNRKMKEAGITEYTDELGHNWKLEGVKSKQWRNTNLRKATKKAVNPFTDETGSRLGSTRASSDARSRDLVPSSAEEVKHVAAMRKEIARINKDLGLKKGNPDFMTLEHRVAQKDWKRLNLPGNPADSPNLWMTKEYEAKIKTAIENIIRKRKSIKGEYIVNFNPQNNSLNITKLDEFDLGIPRGKRFKKNKQGLYNMDAIKQYLNTLE